MKTVIPALAAFVVLGSLATSSIGCSSSSQGSGQSDVDAGSALSQLQNPTGSFSEANAGTAFGNYRSKKSDSQQITAPGVSTNGSSNTMSIKVLDAATSSSACQQGQACACPNGGTISYTASSNADGQLVKATFATCGFEDGFAFDGKAALIVSKKSLLGIAAAPAAQDSAASNSALAILLAAKGTASYGTRKLELAFALETEAQYAFLAVAVSDGSIVIGVNGNTGEAIVKSREGTWKCHETSGNWSCTSEGGKTMNVTEQAPTDPSLTGDSPAPPADPSSGSDDGSGDDTDTDAGVPPAAPKR